MNSKNLSIVLNYLYLTLSLILKVLCLIYIYIWLFFFSDSSIEGITLGGHVEVSFILNALGSLSLELSLVSETVPVILDFINKQLDDNSGKR